MQTSTFRLILNLLLVLSLILPSAATATTDTGMGAAESPAVFADSGLYRTRIPVDSPSRWARLAQLNIVILERNEGSALVLVNGEQLETLARLRFQPQASDELNTLLQAQGEGRQWLRTSMGPVLEKGMAVQALRVAADELNAQAEDAVVATAAAELRAALHALTPEQTAGVASSISPDDDGDGLTNTQEAWWCTDPMNPDSDGDGVSDGDEVAALKAWMANELPGPPASGKPFAGWPPQTTSAGYPDRTFACQDDDRDSVPDLAERWDMGLNMNRESTDRDKFDDGQELFKITKWGWGALPREEDTGYIFAEMPSWVDVPGNHPVVAAFPVPEIDVVPSTLKVETVTTVTTDRTISSGTERSYSTAKTEGTSDSVANTQSWNEWEENYTTSGTISPGLSSLAIDAPIIPPGSVTCPPVQGPLQYMILGAGCTATKFLVNFCADDTGSYSDGKCVQGAKWLGGQVKSSLKSGQTWLSDTYQTVKRQAVDTAGKAKDWIDDNLRLNSCNIGFPLSISCELLFQDRESGLESGILERSGYGTGTSDSVGTVQSNQLHRRTDSTIADLSSYYSLVYPTQIISSQTIGGGRSWGGSQTNTHTTYEEHTITNGEAFSSSESWGTATAVNSAHTADLWFTYKVRNTGTEYARQIKDLAFNIYIGDDPNPACTYHVGSTACGVPVDTVLFSNFMPGEEHTYTSYRIPLTLEQMKTVDLGGPIRIVVEDFTYGADELFYQDAANAGVLLAMEDGTDDGDEAIDTYLIPTWGEETVLDVLGRYFPHTTDENGMMVAVWTPEYRADTPAWCVEPQVVGAGSQRTLWCKHALSTADWWNIYTNNLGDGSDGLHETPASPGGVALFRFNKDSDFDGYSDRSEDKLGTDPADPADYPRPELIAGMHSLRSGDHVTATLSLLNTGLYDAYGVEAVMIAPDDSISIANNTVGGSGRVRAQKQIIVGSRILLETPLPQAWTQANHAQPAPGGYYTGQQDRTYTFSVACANPGGCDVGGGAWALAWNDGAGASGSLDFGEGYASPTLLDVGTLGLKLGLRSGRVNNGDSFTVEARTPRDTFQYTINREQYTQPVVIVSYNDPQGNHRFVTPINIASPTENLAVHSDKMLPGEADVEIVTQAAFQPGQVNTTTLVAQVPTSVHLAEAHLFLEFIDPDGVVVREEARTVSLEPGPNVVDVTWNPADFNPAYNPAQDYIVMAFYTDWQGNILDTAARPLSSFQADPKPAFAFDAGNTTWDFGAVPQGQKLEYTFTLANTGQMPLKAAVIGSGARTDQNVPGAVMWTDTGLDLAAGDALGIRADETVCYGGNGTVLCFDPQGRDAIAPSSWTLPGARELSLIAKIGNGAPFFIGSAFVGTTSTGGRLYLGVNDCTGCYSDNGGSYQAHIEIQGLPHNLLETPSFGVDPTGATHLQIQLDSHYLPVGPFDRTLSVRTSDPAQPLQTFRVVGTVEPYTAQALAMPVSPYRPWDEYVTVAADGTLRSLVTFDDVIGADANVVHPLRVYDDDGTEQLGVGRAVAYAEAQLGRDTVAAQTAEDEITMSSTSPAVTTGYNGNVFGDGRDGVMPGSGNLDNNNGFGVGSASGSAGSTSISVTDRHAVWRINPGDVVLIHQTQGSGAGNWELNRAVSNFTGSGTFTVAEPLEHTYTTNTGNEKAQVLRVPQYSTCNVTGTVTPLYGWNGTTGGIFAVMCSGTLNVQGTIYSDGGNGATASDGNPAGGSGGGYRGGKGDGNVNDNYGGGDAGEGTPGPGSWEGDGTPNGNGGGAGDGTPQRGNFGTGGGGGNGSAGGTSTAGGRGTGGTEAGNRELTNMVFGGGGGGSNDNPGNSIGGGGGGGGIVVIQALNIDVTGSIHTNGGLGGGNKWGAGGGAGGSILLRGKSVNVGSSRITAIGGAARASGGGGGVGRIRIEYCNSTSGSTNPSASSELTNFCTGTLNGRVFSDINGNGTQDAGDIGLSGVSVSISGNGSVSTNSSGDYSKVVSAPASYTVSVTPPAGYDCIDSCSASVSLSPDQTVTTNFALRPRVGVSGKVFHDLNNNQQQDTGEPGLAGRTVTLNTGASATTATDGSYAFNNLTPGSYSVTVTVPDGYLNTKPVSHNCGSITAGQTCTANFGLLQYTIEKTSGSAHQNRLFLPEDFHLGQRYLVRYGRYFNFTAAGEQTGYVRLPKVGYAAATMQVYLATAGQAFVQMDMDVGNDGSWDWNRNGNLTPPIISTTGNLADDLNSFMATATPDAEGYVNVPLRFRLNTTGQVFLFGLETTPTGVADPAVSASDLSLNPTNVIEGDSVSIQATVHNLGSFNSGGFVASAFAAHPEWGDLYVGSALVSAIPASGSAEILIPWDTLGFTGAVPVRLVLDPGEDLGEVNETNNEATANLTILTRPDLHIPSPGLETDPGIALDDAEPVVGQAVQVSVLVQNNGQTGAGASTLALSVEDPNGAASQICAPTPAVPGQSSVTETCAWTPSLPGRHRLYAAADDGGAVNESNESNNRQWRDVYVGFAGPLQLDSGGASDSKYSASNGYGYIDEGAADTVSHCGSAPHQTYRHDPGGAVLYRFDHLLPGHFYHLDLVLFDCAPGAGRQQYVKINGYTVAGPINLSDGQVHRLSLLVDPALYTTRSIVVTVSESESGLGAIVNEISLHDIDYRYADAGSGNDPAYNAERGHGWLDTPAISSWGSRPFETARVDQADNEIRYRFDNLDPGKRYLLRFTFYQGSGVNRMQQIRVNGQSLGADFTLVSGQTYIESRDVPLSAYSTNHDIIASVVRLDTSVGPLISEIALEQRTQASTAACQITATPYRATARGNVTILGQPAPAGSVITAENPRGEVVGCMVTTSAGIYIMTIYGEDTTATPPIPGMRAGEQVIFRVDGSLAVAGPTMVWQNGQVVWVNLDAGAIQGQSILLNPNWNLFSINLQPPATTLSTVLGSISGKYCRVLAENSIYDCTVPERFHTLKDILPGRGYWLRLEGGASANLQVQGTQVDPATPINLHQGWNWIGYLPAFSQPIADALAGIAGDYLWVADGAGSFYDPLFPDFSNLHLMEPGKGYLLYATTDTTLIYPNPVAATGAAGVVAASAVCQEAQPTPYFMVLFGGLTFDGQPAPVGVRVHALTARGEVAGCFQVNTAGQYGFVPIFGADTVEPPVPGFFAGEPITLLVDGLPVSLPEPLLWRDSKAPQRLDLHLPSPQRLYLPTIRQ